MSAKFFSVCHEWFDTLRPEGLQSECACQCVWSEAGGAAAEVIADLAGIVAVHIAGPHLDQVPTITPAPRIASCFNEINASLT